MRAGIEIDDGNGIAVRPVSAIGPRGGAYQKVETLPATVSLSLPREFCVRKPT